MNSEKNLFLAPAKINIFLHITGRRDDGYHLLQSLFVLIDLYDEIYIEVNHNNQINRANSHREIPEKDDLAIRAAFALKEFAQKNRQKLNHCLDTINNLGATITINKKIPMGAGLGGGSSDCATVLLALNKLWQLNFSRQELIDIAVGLGADVPFFIYGKNALVEGIGEIFTPINILQLHLSLIVPPIHVPSADIFRNKNLKRDSKKLYIDEINQEINLNGNFAAEKWKNDLQKTAEELFPNLIEYRQKWSESWNIKELSRFRLTGSGAGYFYIIEQNDHKKEKFAKDNTKMQLINYNSPPFFSKNIFYWSGNTLAKHPLFDFAK